MRLIIVTSLLLSNVLNNCEAELTFTDTRKDKRFTAEVIINPSGTKGNPVVCLTHCLVNKKRCKSINVNQELEKCELLGQSKLMDDSLEMKDEEGWIYYGPKQLIEVRIFMYLRTILR